MKALVFDDQFFEKFERNEAYDYDGSTRTINQVLSNTAVKNLVQITSEGHYYDVPSQVFSCLGLAKLVLDNCSFKPPRHFEGFFNLKQLCLDRICFRARLRGTRINLPQLKKLHLSECRNVYNFNIKAKKLDNLIVITCPDAMLVQLLDSRSLILVGISLRAIDNFALVERVNVVSMLSNLPRIEEFLIEEMFPKWLPRAINSLKLLELANIQLGDLDQLHAALCFLRNSPNLETLTVIHSEMDPRIDAGPALDHLGGPNCLDCTMEQLQTVEITCLEGSKSELLFIKLLLAHSPYLENMTITPSGALGVQKILDIAKDVMRFPRASPNAEMIYLNPTLQSGPSRKRGVSTN